MRGVSVAVVETETVRNFSFVHVIDMAENKHELTDFFFWQTVEPAYEITVVPINVGDGVGGGSDIAVGDDNTFSDSLVHNTVLVK